MIDDSCPLCKKEKKTHWYYNDTVCWVADCLTCKIPMIVLVRHSMDLTDFEFRHLPEIVEILFPGAKLRKKQKKIKDHLHWHILVPKGVKSEMSILQKPAIQRSEKSL